MFTRAIVRPPSQNFGDGLTTAGLGAPNYELALEQHEAYCKALEKCGLTLTRLDADSDYPDSCFVEDAAVIVGALPSNQRRAPLAVLARPGALSRRGEVETMRAVLSELFPSLHEIHSPGTLDGGDICQAGAHFFIGLSDRTNEAGATQLSEFLDAAGYTSSFVDITWSEPGADRGPHAGSPRGVVDATGSLLHLKSGIAYIGDNRLAITADLIDRPEFAHFELIQVERGEEYAANCVRVNDYVLIAKGFPNLESELTRVGYETIALEMSEFQKMDGGLSCLSLRF